MARSQKLFGLLCGLLNGRPLLLVRGAESSKNGLEAARILGGAMEPKEKARSMSAWTFTGGKGTMYEHLVRYVMKTHLNLMSWLQAGRSPRSW